MGVRSCVSREGAARDVRNHCGLYNTFKSMRAEEPPSSFAQNVSFQSWSGNGALHSWQNLLVSKTALSPALNLPWRRQTANAVLASLQEHQCDESIPMCALKLRFSAMASRHLLLQGVFKIPHCTLNARRVTNIFRLLARTRCAEKTILEFMLLCLDRIRACVTT